MNIFTFREKCKYWLEKVGIRCSNCSSWFSTKETTEERLEWGANFGNTFFSDPFYVYMTYRRCTRCGHLMSSKWVSSDRAVE